MLSKITPDQVTPNEIAAWEHQPNEPYEWYQRFELYTQMQGRRSLLRLYREERKRKAQAEPDQAKRQRMVESAEKVAAAPQTFYQFRDKWHWEERLRAYDDHQRDEKKRAESEDREKARSARQMMIKAMHTLLVNVVKSNQTMTDPKDLRELAQAAAVIMKESRLEFGESTEIVASNITATTTADINIRTNDHDTAAGILDILASAGAIQPRAAASDDTESD